MTFVTFLGSALVALASMQPGAATATPMSLCGWKNEVCCAQRVCHAEGTVCMGPGAGKCKVPPLCGGPSQKCCDPLWYPEGPLCKQSDHYCTRSTPGMPKTCELLRCGTPGGMCCPDDSGRPACQSDHECGDNNRCVKKEECGIWDKPGCGPNKDECDPGLALNARGLCDMPCGAHGKMCCEDGSLQPTKCDQSGHPLVCANSKCVKCGRNGQRVCNGGSRPACSLPWLIPMGNHCRRCGHRGGKCCDVGRVGGSGKACRGTDRNTCVSGTCKKCGGRGQRVCHNGGPQCRGMLMNMNNVCMPMGGSD